jgi:WhiB family redox-sensing transcriptional regulator
MNHPRPAAIGLSASDRIRPEELEWQLEGLCREDDPRKWFPDFSQDFSKEARAICMQCPVQKECRDWGLVKGEQYGIWGGLTEEERIAFWKGKPVRRRRKHRSTMEAWGVA